MRRDIAALNRDYINYLTPQTRVFDALSDEDKQFYLSRISLPCAVYEDLQDVASLYDQMWTKVTQIKQFKRGAYAPLFSYGKTKARL